MPNAVIVDAVRTPVGRRNGRALGTGTRSIWPPGPCGRWSSATTSTRPSSTTWSWAASMQVGEQAINIGRNAVLAAGFPESVPGTTVDRQCGSSQQAVHFAAQGVIAGAIRHRHRGRRRVDDPRPDGLHTATPGRARPFGPTVTRPLRTGGLVQPGHRRRDDRREVGLCRDRLDEFAVESHQRAARATDEGRFAQRDRRRSTMPSGTPRCFDRRGHPARHHLEKLASLKPAFAENGVITAGNSSQISDGAAALLIMSEEKAAELGPPAPAPASTPFALAGVDPVIMLTGAIPATQKVLASAGLTAGRHRRCSRSTRPSPRWCWPGCRRSAPTWPRSTSTAAPSRWATRWARSGARLMTTLLHELRAHRRPLRPADHVRGRRPWPTPPSSNASVDPAVGRTSDCWGPSTVRREGERRVRWGGSEHGLCRSVDGARSRRDSLAVAVGVGAAAPPEPPRGPVLG